ncbi:SDR family NAD(P)-dependent oxidoreductase, partial [Streptomyces sp. NPDC001642]|uniref:SDR family NAD(P)-dependent oxidoreductase n=1 Tax=Streptomyces sp. NPDC001642 TaxID=3154392 RepID=UPI00331E8A03
MGLLEDRAVLVNGGSQGVGAGVVRAAAGEGATVVFTGRRPEVGEKLAADTGALFVRADLADPAQARDSVVRTVEAHGRIDCLVNAAGLTSRGSLLDTTPELFDQHM